MFVHTNVAVHVARQVTLFVMNTLFPHRAGSLHRWSHGQCGSENGQTAATDHQREVSRQDCSHYRPQVKTFSCLCEESVYHTFSMSRRRSRYEKWIKVLCVLFHQDQHHHGLWPGAGDASWEGGGVWHPCCSLPNWPLHLPETGRWPRRSRWLKDRKSEEILLYLHFSVPHIFTFFMLQTFLLSEQRSDDVHWRWFTLVWRFLIFVLMFTVVPLNLIIHVAETVFIISLTHKNWNLLLKSIEPAPLILFIGKLESNNALLLYMHL